MVSDFRTYKGFTPYNFQRDVINQLCKTEQYRTKRIVVVKSPRQKGKTITVSNILLFYAINHNKSKNYCISPTLKQAKDIVEGTPSAVMKNASQMQADLISKRLRAIGGVVTIK